MVFLRASFLACLLAIVGCGATEESPPGETVAGGPALDEMVEEKVPRVLHEGCLQVALGTANGDVPAFCTEYPDPTDYPAGRSACERSNIASVPAMWVTACPTDNVSAVCQSEPGRDGYVGGYIRSQYYAEGTSASLCAGNGLMDITD